ncbi:CARDB protein [Methanophagales archaeon]|nr:CARDB protein [Methanophagales archaeon]
MKRINAIVGIGFACIFIVAIVIQAAVGGGIKVIPDPQVIQVDQGTTCTCTITITSTNSDCFYVYVIPSSCCNFGWFDWGTGKKQVCVEAGGSVQLLLNVTPLDDGDCDFKVRVASRRDPRTYAETVIKIQSTPYWSELPDFIITKIWQVGSIIYYELMNVGFADAPAGSTTALYVNGVHTSDDYVNTPLAPNGRIQRSFNNFWIPYPFPGYTIKVCANSNNAIEEIRDNNDCLEENWFNEPITYTKGQVAPVPGVVGGEGWLTSNPTGVGGDKTSTYKSDAGSAGGQSTYKSGVGGGVNEAPTCIALMPNWPQPQPNGMVINWTACAFDPEGDALLYRFVLGRSDLETTPILVQDWSLSNVWKWETNAGDVSMYNFICADVRDSYHANDGTDPDYDNSACLLYWIE